MGGIYKIGNQYFIEFMARGLKYQQLAGSDENAARALLSSIEEKVKNGEALAIVRDTPLVLFLSEFSRSIAGKYSSRTIRRLELAGGHFADFLSTYFESVRLLSDVTPKVIESYRHTAIKAKARPWRINFTLILLREIFEQAVRAGYINDNPTLHIRFVVDQRPRIPKNVKAREALTKGISLFQLMKIMNKDDVLTVFPYYIFLRNSLEWC